MEPSQKVPHDVKMARANIVVGLMKEFGIEFITRDGDGNYSVWWEDTGLHVVVPKER